MAEELATYRDAPVEAEEKAISFWEKIKRFILNDNCHTCNRSFRKSQMGIHPLMPFSPQCTECNNEFWQDVRQAKREEMKTKRKEQVALLTEAFEKAIERKGLSNKEELFEEVIKSNELNKITCD